MPPVGRVEVVQPANRLILPRPLPSSPYRLFPITDQIADKVVATLSTYAGGRESTRVKDLVDLVLIARTQRVDLSELRVTLQSKLRLQGLTDREFAVSDAWRQRYPVVAGPVEALAGRTGFAEAMEIVTEFIQPAMSSATSEPNLAWLPGSGWRVVEPSFERSGPSLTRAHEAFPKPATPSSGRSTDPGLKTPPSPEHTEDRGR